MSFLSIFKKKIVLYFLSYLINLKLNMNNFFIKEYTIIVISNISIIVIIIVSRQQVHHNHIETQHRDTVNMAAITIK